MEKNAKSTDPAQQALRDAKKNWNTAAKEFISRLIAFKKGLNGRGDPKYGLPVSKIQDPLPESIPSFLREVSENFQQLAAAALDITREQADYSEHRRKPHNPENKIASASIAPRLPQTKGYITIGDNTLPTFIAVSAEEQARGLMYLEPPTPIMSFVYEQPGLNRFWMKDTPSQLDIVFALKNRVVSIKKGEPYSTTLIGDFMPSDLVIEMPHGTAKQLGLKVGDKVDLVKSLDNLKDSFIGKYAQIKSEIKCPKCSTSMKQSVCPSCQYSMPDKHEVIGFGGEVG